MGEAQQNHQHEQHLLLRHHHQPAATAGGGRQSRQRAGSRMVKGVGEIVEVQGGHIVRSMGRKDRHSKVCTAKGPRDRRVRLSAHTAIKFYDVQDRLGYDRPSKAVDWLIKNAKAAIDELDELPPWDPLTASATASSPSSSGPVETPLGHQQHQQERGGGHLEAAAAATTASSGFDYAGSGMLPAALESDAIADTIKSFFPITHCAAGLIPSYPPDFLCRTSSTQQAQQDLRLSLHSFHDSVMLHHHHQSSPTTSVEHHASLYSRPPASLAFDAAAAWSDPNHRLGRWGADDSGSGGHFYGTQHLLPQAVPLYPVLTESSYLSHTRGTLQSSNTNTDSQPVGRSWADGMTVSAIDPFTAQQAGSVLCYASNGGGGGIPGLHFRMQVDGEENGGDGVPSASVSPIARH